MTIGDAELHVCQDDSIPYTHFEYRCATFWGCDGSGRFMKDNVICLSNSYQILIAGTLDVYTCAKPYFGDCSISYSETIYSREDNEDGSYTVSWNSGNTWMNVSPED
jgi:hypothetical protein